MAISYFGMVRLLISTPVPYRLLYDPMPPMPIRKLVHKIDMGLIIMKYCLRKWSTYANLVVRY